MMKNFSIRKKALSNHRKANQGIHLLREDLSDPVSDSGWVPDTVRPVSSNQRKVGEIPLANIIRGMHLL